MGPEVIDVKGCFGEMDRECRVNPRDFESL